MTGKLHGNEYDGRMSPACRAACRVAIEESLDIDNVMECDVSGENIIHPENTIHPEDSTIHPDNIIHPEASTIHPPEERESDIENIIVETVTKVADKLRQVAGKASSPNISYFFL